MAVPFIAVYYTPPNGDEVQLNDFVLLDNKRGVDLKSGTGTFRVNNSQYRNKTDGVTDFVEDGAVEIYCDYSPITRASSQLLISGLVRELKPRYGESGSEYEVTVADKTVLLLGGLWGEDAEGTPPSIINTVVSWVSKGTVTTNNVAASKHDGTAFSSVQMAKTFKPVTEWISELSQPDYTGDDRAYMFYVDKDNDLHWFYPAQTSSGTIVEGTDDIRSISLNRNADSIVNMIIFNAGQDLVGNGKLSYHWDATTKSSTLRMKYYPMIEIAKDLKDIEIAQGNIVQNASGTCPHKGLLYAVATSGTTSWGLAFSSASDYNDKFRDEIGARGIGKAKLLIQRLGKLLWNGSVELKGTNSFVAGDLLTITSQTLGISNYLLRVVDVQQHISTNGWSTTIELKEDEEAIVA